MCNYNNVYMCIYAVNLFRPPKVNKKDISKIKIVDHVFFLQFYPKINRNIKRKNYIQVNTDRMIEVTSFC